jgi:opacity protein-like surface antigen
MKRKTIILLTALALAPLTASASPLIAGNIGYANINTGGGDGHSGITAGVAVKHGDTTLAAQISAADHFADAQAQISRSFRVNQRLIVAPLLGVGDAFVPRAGQQGQIPADLVPPALHGFVNNTQPAPQNLIPPALQGVIGSGSDQNDIYALAGAGAATSITPRLGLGITAGVGPALNRAGVVWQAGGGLSYRLHRQWFVDAAVEYLKLPKSPRILTDTIGFNYLF